MGCGDRFVDTESPTNVMIGAHANLFAIVWCVFKDAVEGGKPRGA